MKEENTEISNIETKIKLESKNTECNICGKTVSKGNLRAHEKTHALKKPHQCDICSKTFLTNGNLNTHKKLHNEDVKKFQCDTCEAKFSNPYALKTHEEIHSSKNLFCQLCNKTFSPQSRHEKSHYESTFNECETCGKSFANKKFLKAHEKRHSANKRFQCETCNKSFVTKNDLKIHQMTHSGKKSFKCEICEFNCSDKSNLKKHVASVHN